MPSNQGVESAAEEQASVRDTSRTGWILVGVQALLLVMLLALPWRRSLGESWPPNLLEVPGFILMVLGLTITMIAMLGLGSALTATPVPSTTSTLRTGGIYGVVRHPIYVGILIAAFGFTLAVGSLWQVLLLVVLTAFLGAKALWEDNLLADHYGVPWFDYADHVGGFLPRLRSRR